MLKIFNDLNLFFENCFQEVSVREYAKKRKISPPTASKLLMSYKKEGLLNLEKKFGYHFFSANNNNNLFKNIHKTYWAYKIEKSGLLIESKNNHVLPVVILFGSIQKAENTKDSDIDMAIFSNSKTNPDYSKYSEKLSRELQVFTFSSTKEINKELRNNILSGFILEGVFLDELEKMPRIHKRKKN